jgi:hypothetical protein
MLGGSLQVIIATMEEEKRAAADFRDLIKVIQWTDPL